MINKQGDSSTSFKLPQRSSWLYFILTLLSVAAVCCILKLGITAEQIINFQGRADEGSVELAAYLKSGDFSYLSNWLDLVIGASPAVDFTLYAGLIPVLLLPFFRIEKKNLHITILIVLILLFSSGSFISRIFYYWPFMSYFRHLTPAMGIAKIFLCFLMGFALDRFVTHNLYKDEKAYNKWFLIVTGIIFLAGYLYLENLGRYYDHAESLLRIVIPAPNPYYTFSRGEIFSLFSGQPVSCCCYHSYAPASPCSGAGTSNFLSCSPSYCFNFSIFTPINWHRSKSGPKGSANCSTVSSVFKSSLTLKNGSLLPSLETIGNGCSTFRPSQKRELSITHSTVSFSSKTSWTSAQEITIGLGLCILF